MMKWLLIAAFCLPVALTAQKLVLSEELPLRTDMSYDIIGEIKGRVLIFRNRVDKFEVQAFDDQMRSSWSKPVELEKRNPSVLGINTVRDSFSIIYTCKEKGNTVIRADLFDASANKKKTLALRDYGYMFFNPRFTIVRSEDRSKVLIYHIDKDIFSAVCFDNVNMKVMWDSSFPLDSYLLTDDISHVQLSNEGRMYSILEKDNYGGRKEKHRIVMFTYGGEKDPLSSIIIPMQDRLTYGVSFLYDNINERLTAGGLYFERNSDRAEGFFYLSIPRYNPDSYILSFNVFDDKFVSDLEGKDVRQNRGIGEIDVRNIVLRRDGGLILIGEENLNSVRTISTSSFNRFPMDNLGARSSVDYYYNDIFVIAIHPNGEPHWKDVLYKKQFSQDDSAVFSSYFLVKTARNLRLIFNDEIKMENTVSEYVLKGDGAFNRNSMLSTEHLKLHLRFRDAVQVSADKVIVPSERRGQLRIAKIHL
jgi:hypothetical protein